MSNESPIMVQQTAIITPDRSYSMSLLDNLARIKWKLREVRIVAQAIDSNGEPAAPFSPTGVEVDLGLARIFGLASMIDFGLRLQSTYLTVPRHVPAELLRSPFFDSLSEPEDPTAFSSATGFDTPGPQRAVIWTFPKPLFVPAGAKMYAELLFNAAEGANSFLWTAVAGQVRSCAGIQVQVTLIGNRCENEPLPAKSCVPYATTYRTPKLAIGADGQEQTFRAEDFQLQNHCDEPIYVQRLTACNTGAQRMPTAIRYSTSDGKFINRELAPLPELHSNGALSLHTVLDKNEFIAVEGEIDSTPAREDLPYDAPYNAPPLATYYEQQAMFGLVGYREVDTVALWGPALVNPITGQQVNDLRRPEPLPHLVELRQPQLKPHSPALPWPKKP